MGVVGWGIVAGFELMHAEVVNVCNQPFAYPGSLDSPIIDVWILPAAVQRL